MKNSEQLTREFLREVTREAKQLRLHTTQAEKERLVPSEISPSNRKLCVYGQLTGHCESNRAYDLMCLTGVCETSRDIDGELVRGRTRLKHEINLNKHRLNRYRQRCSPIEIYIMKAPRRRTEELVEYIKGERQGFRATLPEYDMDFIKY